MPLASPISVADIRSNFGAAATLVNAAKALGAMTQTIPLRRMSLADTDTLLSRSIAFTPQDDQDIDTLYLFATDAAGGGRVVTVALTEDGVADPVNAPETRYVPHPVQVSGTTISGNIIEVEDFRPVTGTRVRLLKGVRYRLSMTCETVGTVVGPVVAVLQLRPVRRGGSPHPLILPNALRVGGAIDAEKVNENLRALADGIAEDIERRYTHSMAIVDLSGMVDNDAEVERQIPVNIPGASRSTTIAAVELVLSDATAATTWTLTKDGDPLWPAIAALAAGADYEVYASTSVDILVDGGEINLTLTPSTSAGAASITRGYLVVHFVSDRWAQGSAKPSFSPTPIRAVSSTAAATLGDQIDDAAQVADDEAQVTDGLRCMMFVVRNLGVGASSFWRLPAGDATTILGARLYVVAAGTVTCRATVDGTNIDVVGGGITVRTTGTGSPVFAAGDPLDSADDLQITLAHQAGATAVLLGLLVVWYR